MKIPLFTAIWLAGALLASAQNKPAAAAPANVPQQLSPNQQAFLNLPQERRDQFVKHLQEANRLFRDKRVFETLGELDKADAIFKDSPEVLNLRGSCYVEFRSFDKALESFRAAEKLSPGNPSVLFNIGEVLFVTRKWREAHDVLSAVLKVLPKQKDQSFARLIEFKVLLCKLRLGQKDEAVAMADKYDYLDDDTPYYYYAHASLSYHDGNTLKAEEWLAIAGRVFRAPGVIAPWQDTLVEFGYIKSFYGDPNSAE
jgi:tetratricopeptide (TPR) repeat protein